ncbi:hypothetical protein BV898_17926 [Hypsibius exemplaris]|uniref:CUB domain-containing protein n=1 Tax=Hypsibius exemplaris TaxID=2072580 RepID=A0A9X6NPK2_HYPEX|nr:hypothetical protein BV898_17926 [Hypsibius exemplaris]
MMFPLVFYFVLINLCSALDTNYPKEFIDCDRSDEIAVVTLPCSANAQDRAGTLELYQPRASCNFTVTVDSTLCTGTQKYAIYFNIKKQDLAAQDIIEIYEGPALVRILTGGNQYSVGLTSYGQVLSNFSRKPTFDFWFEKETNQDTIKYSSLELDYVVVTDTPVSLPGWETKCQALSGFILDRHFCETGDRVNCPFEYNDLPVTYTQIGRPGANIPGYCVKSITTPRTTTRNYYNINTWNQGVYTGTYHSYSSFSGLTIAGIVIGTVFGVIMLFFILVRLFGASAKRNHVTLQETSTRHVVPSTSSQHLHQNSFVNYGYQPNRSYMPPSPGQTLPTIARDFMVPPPPAYTAVYPAGPPEDTAKF